MLEDSGLLAANPSSMPLDPNVKLSTSDGKLLVDPFSYRRIIGHLIYLTLSRPDITFAVHKLSQFVAQPRHSHLMAAHNLL